MGETVSKIQIVCKKENKFIQFIEEDDVDDDDNKMY